MKTAKPIFVKNIEITGIDRSICLHGILPAADSTHIAGLRQMFKENGKALPTLVVISLWKDCGTYMIYWLAGLQGVSSDAYEAATL